MERLGLNRRNFIEKGIDNCLKNIKYKKINLVGKDKLAYETVQETNKRDEEDIIDKKQSYNEKEENTAYILAIFNAKRNYKKVMRKYI